MMSKVPFTLTALTNGRLVEATLDTMAVCTLPLPSVGIVVQDWLAVIPVSLAPAVEWADSSTVLSCSSALPVIAQIARRSVATWVAVPAAWSRRPDDVGYQVLTATMITLSGQRRMAGRSLALHGEGQGSQLFYIDSELGIMLGGAANSSTRVVVEAGSQRQEFVQAVSRRIVLLR